MRGPAAKHAIPRLLIERKNNINRGVDLDRLPIQERRLINPLFHGIHRRLKQQWVPRYHFDFLHRAVFSNDGVQTHSTRNARLASQWWVSRLNSLNQFCTLTPARRQEVSGLQFHQRASPTLALITCALVLIGSQHRLGRWWWRHSSDEVEHFDKPCIRLVISAWRLGDGRSWSANPSPFQ